jgi:hypothetical protein
MTPNTQNYSLLLMESRWTHVMLCYSNTDTTLIYCMLRVRHIFQAYQPFLFQITYECTADNINSKRKSFPFLCYFKLFVAFHQWKLSALQRILRTFKQRRARSEMNFGIERLNIMTPLWSSDQSLWLQIQRSRVRFLALPDFLRSRGSGTGSTQPCEDNWGATWMKK